MDTCEKFIDTNGPDAELIITSYATYISAYFCCRPLPNVAEYMFHLDFMMKLFSDRTYNISGIEIELLRFLYFMTYTMTNEDFEPIAHSVCINDVCYRLVLMMDDSEEDKRCWAVMTLANLTWFDEDFYDDLFKDTYIIQKLKICLGFTNEGILTDALLMVGNFLSSDNPYRHEMLADKDFLIQLIFIIYAPKSEEVLQIAIRTLGTALSNSSDPRIIDFCANNIQVLDLAMDKIDVKADSTTMLRICELIKKLFAIGDAYMETRLDVPHNVFTQRVKEDDGLMNKLLKAQEHPSIAVAHAFYDLVTTNFEYEEVN